MSALLLVLFAAGAWVGSSIGLTGTVQIGMYAVDAQQPTRTLFGLVGLLSVAGIVLVLRWAWNRHVLGHHITPDGVLRNRSGRPVR